MLKNDIFLRACKRMDIDRTPVWLLNQASPFLAEHRALRDKHDYLTLCKTPELAAELTAQPIDILGTDAAILFSDHLLIAEAMGMDLSLIKGIGPVFSNPIRSSAELEKLRAVDIDADLAFLPEAVRQSKDALGNRVPLIAAAASPWTVFCYMIEGRDSKTFSKVKAFCYKEPVLAYQLLSKLADLTADVLSAQIEAGADAVQIVDLHGGILDQPDYQRYSLRYIETVLGRLRRKDDEPVIVYSKGVHHSLMSIARSGATVLGLDRTMDLGFVRQRLGEGVALQGNLDPSILYADRSTIREKVIQVLDSHGKGTGHIFNFGENLSPDVSPANVKFMVECVKDMSAENHEISD